MNDDIKYRLLQNIRRDIDTLVKWHYKPNDAAFLENAIDFFDMRREKQTHLDIIFTPDNYQADWGDDVEKYPRLDFSICLRLKTSGTGDSSSSTREWTGRVIPIPLFTTNHGAFSKCESVLGAAHVCVQDAHALAAGMLRDALKTG